MNFFVPHASDAAAAESVYASIVSIAEKNTGWKISPKRFYKAEFVHNGKDETAEVGKEFRKEGIVYAILRSNSDLVVTLNRGLKYGDPIMIGNAYLTEFQS